MSKVVFILGAGASKQCGAPLMNDFLDIASQLYYAKEVEADKIDFENVFNAIGALQVVHSKSQLDLSNIESIFTTLELSKILNKFPTLETEEITKTIASLKKLIVKTLERTIKFPVNQKYIGVPEPYNHFSALIKNLQQKNKQQYSISILTFNYDIAVDMALYKAQLGPDYSIKPTSTHPNRIPLLKLHGSLNWATREDDNSVYPLLLENYFKYYKIDFFHDQLTSCHVPIGSQLKEYFSKHEEFTVQPEPIIIPPSWNKSDYHQSLSTVWENAAKHLGEAEYIFIIGYSLPQTDMFFKLLYALGSVGDNPLKKFVVYNPDESVENRFKEILGPGALKRFKFFPFTFKHAINEIMNEIIQ